MADDLRTLEALNTNYVRSVAESDVAWFDAHLAADFMNRNADGTLLDRAGFLAQVARPSPVSSIQAEDVQIRMVGGTAIIHARTTYKKPDGQPGGGWYTDIWVREGGAWRCAAAHVSRG
jgi:hypothetical protein